MINFSTHTHRHCRRLIALSLLFLLTSWAARGQTLAPKALCGTDAGYSEEELRQLPWADNNQYLVGYLRDHGVTIPVDYIDQIKYAESYARQGYEPRTLSLDEVSQIDAEGNRGYPGMQYVPIKAWIHQRSDGTGGRSIGQVRQDIVELNAEFARSNVPITFYLKCDIGYVPNTGYYNQPDGAALDYMWRTWFDSRAINVHFVGEPESVSPGKYKWAGIARIPNYFSPRFVLTIGDPTFYGNPLPSVFAHEIGHTLGLPHTHNARDQSKTVLYNGQSGDCYQEPVSRTRTQEFKCLSTWGDKKAEANGDALIDTPGDPILQDMNGSHVQKNFSTGQWFYDGGLNDRWGDQWRPDVYNLMSYGAQISERVGVLTPMQSAIMLYFATFTSTPGTTLTISGPSYLCSGFAPFQVSPVPTTAVTWTLPPGWSLQGQGSASVQVAAPSGTPAGTYTLFARTDCGIAQAAFKVTIGGFSTAMRGPALVCPGTYTNFAVTYVSGATYQWFAPAGWTVSTTGTYSKRILAGPNAVSGQLRVEVTLCGTTTQVVKAVDVRDPSDPDCEATSCRGCLPQRQANQLNGGVKNDWQVEALPNPAGGYLTIRVTQSSKAGATATLLDSFGRTVRVQSQALNGQLDMLVSDLPRGLYLLRVTAGANHSTTHVELN